ncbi:division/cell wall cluster transcriptional repressor MraZ [Myroides ceti]|uniref:Transcriptional regulator MraZ n=1 Tax=Paenimyroides ceti TaxID=395087 RepID=A0ABT8CXC9_9FLAO|nr:division/cell wall cluster transcriptional repressor MraZ [Paenimyroides ceti]MDN3708396.1 division/cell wall cluster transcriptional repressor MraZ [Paenimyroides ceti]
MNAIVGTYECKIDAKGRALVPVALKKQLPAIADGFVLKRSVFESCLELWPMQEWNKMMEKINKLNRFNRKNDLFVRKFMAGVKNVEIDDAGRLLLSKDLIEFAKINKEIVFSSKLNVVEIWDKDLYEQTLEEDIDFADLAEEVMGNIETDEQ